MSHVFFETVCTLNNYFLVQKKLTNKRTKQNKTSETKLNKTKRNETKRSKIKYGADFMLRSIVQILYVLYTEWWFAGLKVIGRVRYVRWSGYTIGIHVHVLWNTYPGSSIFLIIIESGSFYWIGEFINSEGSKYLLCLAEFEFSSKFTYLICKYLIYNHVKKTTEFQT